MSDLARLAQDHEQALAIYLHELLRYPDLARAPDDNLEQLAIDHAQTDDRGLRFAFGRMLLKGRDDYLADPTLAETYLTKAAEAGDGNAQFQLFLAYSQPSNDLYDPDRANAWRERFEGKSTRFDDLLAREVHLKAADVVDPTPLELASMRAEHANRTGDAPPIPVFQAPPVYPLAMRMDDIEGQVMVGFVIDKNGDPQEIIATSSTHPEFEPAAVAAVTRWRFAPSLKQGNPVNIRMQVPIIFSITD